MKAEFVDIGVNLSHARFACDREAVIARAREAGVDCLLVTGVDQQTSRAALALAERHPAHLRATAGFHPHHASDWTSSSGDALRALAADQLVVAIGETGLDFNRVFSPRPSQERAFAAQLEIAAELGLPVFLHQRDAADRFIAILREFRDQLPAAVAHCFTDSRDTLYRLLDLDCHIGITGWLCDERRGSALRACVADIPDARLLIETDAPFLTPRDLRPKPAGGRNEPAFLPHIAAATAALRGTTVDHIALCTTDNARRVFSLPEATGR